MREKASTTRKPWSRGVGDEQAAIVGAEIEGGVERLGLRSARQARPAAGAGAGASTGDGGVSADRSPGPGPVPGA